MPKSYSTQPNYLSSLGRFEGGFSYLSGDHSSRLGLCRVRVHAAHSLELRLPGGAVRREALQPPPRVPRAFQRAVPGSVTREA